MSFLWLFEIHSVLLLSVVALLVAFKMIYTLVLILAIFFNVQFLLSIVLFKQTFP